MVDSHTRKDTILSGTRKRSLHKCALLFRSGLVPASSRAILGYISLGYLVGLGRGRIMGSEQDKSIQKVETKKKRKSLDEQLADSKLRTQQLEALKRKRDARERAKLNNIERAKDTRRKVLLGAIV